MGWSSKLIGHFASACGHTIRRVERRPDCDHYWQHARPRIKRALRGHGDVKGIALVVTDVPGLKLGLAVIVRRWVVVARGDFLSTSQVGVVEMQAPHLLVVVGCLVDVRSSGHHAAREIGETTAENEKPAHPAYHRAPSSRRQVPVSNAV